MTATRTALVAGCGNIGSRLLQSLASITEARLDVYGMEPFAAARELSAERFAEVNANGHALHWVDDANPPPAEVDLAIVAVDARNRLAALEGVLDVTRPRNVLLEKVLFTKRADYAAAEEMLGGLGAPVWVNTSRNLWPGYQALRAELPDAPFALDVDGVNWGMGSNAIHFLSLVEYLSGSPVVELDFLAEGPELESKRGGYREFTGTLTGRTERGDSLRVHAGPGEIAAPAVTLAVGDTVHAIREGGGEIATGSEVRPFRMLYTSQLAGALGEMMEGHSELPTLAESTRLHMKMLEAFDPGFSVRDGAELAIT